MHIPSALALAAALVAPAVHAFEFTAPSPDTPLNLNASSIRIEWQPSEGGPEDYNAVDIEWVIRTSSKSGPSSIFSSSGRVGTNVSQPRVTSLDWNPREAREVLEGFLPQGDGRGLLFLRYWLMSPNPNIGRGGSEVKFAIEGVEEYDDESSAGGFSARAWVALGVGLAALGWAL